MPNAFFQVPYPENEPVLPYGPGSPEREAQLAEYERMLTQDPVSVPMVIGGRQGLHRRQAPPPDPASRPPARHRPRPLRHGSEHVKEAIDAALEARTLGRTRAGSSARASSSAPPKCSPAPGAPASMRPRCSLRARTFIRPRSMPPVSSSTSCGSTAISPRRSTPSSRKAHPALWNRLEYRALEGFVFAITPFNFTAIAGNLPISAALMGNVVVWKPSDEQIYSAHVIMELLHEAGLPEGVINLVTVDGPVAGDVVFNHPDFSGLHFTGSTGVFRHLWQTIGENIAQYKTYPRIVGETGGKDFILAHASADVDEVVTGIVRGAFEFQGQKCSAASRVYLPDNLWPEIQEKLLAEVGTLKVGTPADPTNFVGAVINRRSFDNIKGYIDYAREPRRRDPLRRRM